MRLSRLVLHVGTHKTGSTAIQDAFFANSELLAEKGVIYPRLSVHSGHHGLVTDWAKAHKAYVLAGGSRAALRRIAETHGDSDRTVILSSEEFSRGQPGNSVDLAELREILSAFDSFEVICVLRTQWQFLQSVYLEISKGRSPARPTQWVSEALRTGSVQGLWIDYTRLLDRLESAFDPSEIRLIDYATACAAPGGLIGTVLAQLAPEMTAEDLVLANGGISNASPLPLASMCANMLCEPAKASPAVLELATRILRQLVPDALENTCIFSCAEFEQLAAHFAPSNAALEARRSAWQPDFRLSPADAKSVTLFRDTLPGGYWLHLARTLLHQKPAG